MYYHCLSYAYESESCAPTSPTGLSGRYTSEEKYRKSNVLHHTTRPQRIGATIAVCAMQPALMC